MISDSYEQLRSVVQAGRNIQRKCLECGRLNVGLSDENQGQNKKGQDADTPPLDTQFQTHNLKNT